MKMNSDRRVSVFSHSEGLSEKAHELFVTHLGKVGLGTATFLVLLFTIEGQSFSLTFMALSLAFVAALTLLAILFHRKFAKKIVFDPKSREVEFHLYRRNQAIVADIDQVNAKQVPGHVIFRYDGRKIWYRCTEDNDPGEYFRSIL